ncbi:MAG: hypothetical protein KJ747_02350, partial [Actinobacteria bacterium]|nr:hypothetical protein [Actinomycetota bacterium]MCG2807218.1 hypothetical protein [Coriobacteriia bacterium]
AIFAGPGTILGKGDIAQVDIAPTVASLLGMRIPQQSVGRVRDDIIADSEGMVAIGEKQYLAFARVYASRMGESAGVGKAQRYDEVEAALSKIDDARLVKDREARLPIALAGAGAALLALALLFAASWRAGVAAMTGTLAYYAVYNGLYFWVHGYLWSLSAFNTEEYVQSFFYMRMAEAALAALIGCVVAAAVYPLLRARPRAPRSGFLGGWVALGPATTLSIVATLAIQVAWFFWAWGADVVWRLPDLKWGFKYDLDLTQITAAGAVALLAPVVTYLVGRYHPKVRNAAAEE